ncbi:hypothetical protein [Marinimicrobium locisalis]|uniref:hypothetical protein n=1 Tax=Marinimicrobium locisalis TaxID=546022 RepID=UPI003221CB5A
MKLRSAQVAVLVAMFTLSATASANYLGNREPRSIFGAGVIKFGVDNPPDDTCDYHNRTFKFDGTTERGKNILSILLAAKMAGKNVNIWYSPSSKPGTSASTGCTINDMAIINEIGIN